MDVRGSVSCVPAQHVPCVSKWQCPVSLQVFFCQGLGRSAPPWQGQSTWGPGTRGQVAP